MTKLCGLKLFDFSKESIANPKAWKRLGVLLRYLHRELRLESSKISFQYALANLTVATDPKTARQVAANCYDEFVELFERIQLLEVKSKEQREKEKIAAIEQQYRETIGDPNDPKLLKQIEENYVKLKNGEMREISKEEEIARIVAQRQEQQRRRRRK